jgi:glycosyltransferase involved in cell wall biosynthesis
MKKLSVVIITFNEEKNISKCLASVQDIADEILVVDSFSTDKTRDICTSYNARFLQKKFEGYRDQKNFANSQARYDYILSLDADEVLSSALKEAIKKEKENDFEFDIYSFNRLNFFCGKAIRHGGWYPDRKIRLWRKNKAKWSGNNLHEIIETEKETSQKHLNADLLHYSFSSVNQHIAQVNTFSDMKAKLDFEAGKSSGILKIISLPLIKFFLLYFFKLGFLDGYYGLIIAINSAHFTFLRYVKLHQLKNSKSNSQSGNIHSQQPAHFKTNKEIKR